MRTIAYVRIMSFLGKCIHTHNNSAAYFTLMSKHNESKQVPEANKRSFGFWIFELLCTVII